jgi:RNA polymerase sigma-70 factor (ECF subfamily)
MDNLRPDSPGTEDTMPDLFPAEDSPARPPLPEPDEWLRQYGDTLYRYAVYRLRRPQEAEDAVQETLLAALKARGQFQGRSHPRTWLMTILKRKVADRLRLAARQVAETNLDDLDAWFDTGGHWRKAPRQWDNPTAAAESSEFWEVVQGCLAKLPPRMAEVFTLRTLDDWEPTDVCRELAISPDNLWVLLHRARLRLVRCLDIHWFQPEH